MTEDKNFLPVPTDNGQLMVPFQQKDPFPEGWEAAEAIPMDGGDIPAPVKREVWPRWVRFGVGPNPDHKNYSYWVRKGFRKATKEDMVNDTFNSYWNEQEKSFWDGENILMVGSRKKVLGAMKYNYISANARINNRLNEFSRTRMKSPQGATLAQNYSPEVEFHGPVAVFPEDGPVETNEKEK